jgi:hypothetical protein
VNFTINASAGTGSGIGGNIIFQVAPSSTSSSIVNTLTSVLVIDSTLTSTFNGNVKLNSTSTTKMIYNGVNVTVNTSTVILDSFSSSLYRSAKYLVSVANTVTNSYQFSEVLLIQNGNQAYINQVSVYSTGTSTVTFSASLTTGTVALSAAGVQANNQIKIAADYMTI